MGNSVKIPDAFDDRIRHIVGKNIRKTRKKNNMSLVELYRKTNISDGTIRHWEMGVQAPNIVSLMWLCKCTGWRMGDLLRTKEDADNG